MSTWTHEEMIDELRAQLVLTTAALREAEGKNKEAFVAWIDERLAIINPEVKRLLSLTVTPSNDVWRKQREAMGEQQALLAVRRMIKAEDNDE